MEVNTEHLGSTLRSMPGAGLSAQLHAVMSRLPGAEKELHISNQGPSGSHLPLARPQAASGRELLGNEKSSQLANSRLTGRQQL